MDFLLVLIERFSLGVTAYAPRAKIDRKWAISLQRGQFDPIFQVEGDIPTPIIFARIGRVRPINALQQFSQKKNFVPDFRQAKCDFTWKTAVLRFWGNV